MLFLKILTLSKARVEIFKNITEALQHADICKITKVISIELYRLYKYVYEK